MTAHEIIRGFGARHGGPAAPSMAFTPPQQRAITWLVLALLGAWLLRVFGLMPWLNNLFHSTPAPAPPPR